MIARGARIRLLILAVALFGCGGVVSARLAVLQLVRGDELALRAQKQRQHVHRLVPRRGDILDRHGSELAVSVSVEAVAAHPAQVADPAAAARTLAPLLGLPARQIEARLHSASPYVYLHRDATPDQARQVRAAALPGIVLEPQSRRVYPSGALASHALGFVGRDSTPLGGIELAFDASIRGTDGSAVDLTDATGVPFAHQVIAEAIPGETLQLTLDLTIQHVLEEELDHAARLSRAKAGSALALDPATGEVLALASWPTFNPNAFPGYSDRERQDRVVVSAYEPGSTFKIITAAAALELGLVRPAEVFYCGRGRFQIGRYTIRDHKVFDDLTFTRVMAESSNVGAIKAGMRVPRQAFYDTIRRFGFGEKTGVGLPGEQAGLLRAPEAWSLLSQPGLSIGQEVLVTPMQLAAAVGAVANGGVLVRPWIARGLLDRDGRVLQTFPAPVPRRVISEKTARTLTEMLTEVVADGTGKAAAVPGYTVAGKTGTAQKSDPRGGGYLDGRYVASFVGYAPAWNPRLVALFVLDEPGVKTYHGGDVAAPAFGRFAARVLPGLGVPPDRRAPEGAAPERLVVRRGPAAAPPGTRWVTLHRTGEAVSSARTSPPPMAAGTPDGTMPDLTGLTTREAVATLTALGLAPRLEGRGRVTAQEPAPGLPLPLPQEGCQLWLGLP